MQRAGSCTSVEVSKIVPFGMFLTTPVLVVPRSTPLAYSVEPPSVTVGLRLCHVVLRAHIQRMGRNVTTKPQRVSEVSRIVVDVGVEVRAVTAEANWVLAHKPSGSGIKISRAVVVDPRFRVELAACITERICDCSRRRG